MDLKQLEAFVHVVKLNSFSKAADMIYLSQPTISSHISTLEKELKTQLLIRSTKEVYPTKAGVEFFTYAQNMLSLRDQAIQSVNGMNRNAKGEIVVISSSVPAQYLLPEIITNFRKRHPNIKVRVHQSDSGHVGAQFGNCYYDFGITGTQITGNKFLQKPFCDDTMVIACPAKMDIKQPVTKENLMQFIKAHPFIMRDAGSGTLQELENYLRKDNMSLNELKPVCYFNNTQGVMQAVACGMGISFVSKVATTLYEQTGLVKTIEIDNKDFLRRFYLLIKKDMLLSPIQKLFADYIENYYTEDPV